MVTHAVPALSRWSNWGATYSCTPTRIESPASEEEIAALAWTLIALGLLTIPKIFWLTDAIVGVVVVLAAAWYFLALRGQLNRGEAGVAQLNPEAPAASAANPAD